MPIINVQHDSCDSIVAVRIGVWSPSDDNLICPELPKSQCNCQTMPARHSNRNLPSGTKYKRWAEPSFANYPLEPCAPLQSRACPSQLAAPTSARAMLHVILSSSSAPIPACRRQSSNGRTCLAIKNLQKNTLETVMVTRTDVNIAADRLAKHAGGVEVHRRFIRNFPGQLTAHFAP